MDSKTMYLNLEQSCRAYVPGLNHHVKESLYRPEENFLKIKLKDEVVRTIKEEDIDAMWHAAKMALESFVFSYMEKEAMNV
ncbi:hypothetical protein [Pseudobutyrivibrio ruminis]|uniref:Uncharacterized protein n=1 Tax=Pseudobutyrivibrio ruminis TaxID=46206 RepID=A0A2G3DYF3_9FIRM|nr:hypothetical protein [Pseudobutyrivibrio ruminis]PHU36034.1 hypothetical protein CSX01_02015 [Pseudobutyrivibrio ruminis]